MHFVEPSFEIDEKGRVICKEHSNYNYFMRPGKDFFYDMLLERQLTCKTCSHYFDNNCYFQKSEIDEIDEKRIRKKKHFRCNLCHHKISIMLSVVQKIYNEEKYNIKIPLVCCDCYERIKNDEVVRESINRILFTLFLFFLGFFFFSINLFLVELFDLLPIVILFYLIPLLIFFVWGINQLFKIVIGIRFYNKYYKDGENELIMID